MSESIFAATVLTILVFIILISFILPIWLTNWIFQIFISMSIISICLIGIYESCQTNLSLGQLLTLVFSVILLVAIMYIKAPILYNIFIIFKHNPIIEGVHIPQLQSYTLGYAKYKLMDTDIIEVEQGVLYTFGNKKISGNKVYIKYLQTHWYFNNGITLDRK